MGDYSSIDVTVVTGKGVHTGKPYLHEDMSIMKLRKID